MVTTYKAQGLTIGKIVVDIQSPTVTSQVTSIYVSFSRVKRAEDVAILRSFRMKVLDAQPSSAHNVALKLLDELDSKTQRESAHFTV